jgi:hypothetical protein
MKIETKDAEERDYPVYRVSLGDGGKRVCLPPSDLFFPFADPIQEHAA